MHPRFALLVCVSVSFCAHVWAATSPRVIVEFATPPLTRSAATRTLSGAGTLNISAPSAQAHLARIAAEQQRGIGAITALLPPARVAQYINETGRRNDHSYMVAFNGVALDVGEENITTALRVLPTVPGVKAVYRDQAYQPALYASPSFIGVTSLWSHAAINGGTNAGRGIKIASMDGGVHHASPMFNGAGYNYPHGYPAGGLGVTNNNNGKIIASRAYFRTWDPPAPGESNVWPGVLGTSHGVHTAGIAGGNAVTASIGGLVTNISGVAPGAWIMSYRVFYYSVSAGESFFTAEGLAALEDIVRDGAQVVNNSWGSGPTGSGGAGDPLDQALINASHAGVFVSMSAGNSGPSKGTLDHPSAEYITVAASSTPSGFSGRLNVTAPVPVPDALTGMPYQAASFGGVPPLAQSRAYAAAEIVAPGNPFGANPFAANTFTGRYALIRRGSVEYGIKCLNAQNAGALGAIIFNNAGNDMINMGAGVSGVWVTIPCVFISQSNGEALVRWSTNALPATAQVEIKRVGNIPDRIAGFSSRGPGAGATLKPDITAPGVDTLSQGYTPGATGELRHLGYGQASGTSMASPHVAGAAALLRQIHPTWPNAAIKSALMSTAKYLDIYNANGTPAQPLDMGAGRLDLRHAADPGVILQPPSVGFGFAPQGRQATQDVQLINVAGVAETYTISTLSTINGFGVLTSFTGLNVTPPSVAIPAGGTAVVQVVFSPAGLASGDHQGYVILSGTVHQAHFPVWARVTPTPGVKDILLLDNDGSGAPGPIRRDYLAFYTNALQAAGLSYDVRNLDALYGAATTVPDPAELPYYKALLYFTGDNASPSTPSWPTALDQQRLLEYANGGGRIIAMGQNIAGGLGNAGWLHNYVLGGWQLQASVSGGGAPSTNIVAWTGAPPVLAGINLDVRFGGDGASNQISMDELSREPWSRAEYPTNGYYPYEPLLVYPGTHNVAHGVVAVGHRDQPTLEYPGVSFLGRAIYTTFGLEGVNNAGGTTHRAQLVKTFWNYLNDEPSVTVDALNWIGSTYRLTAHFSAGGPGSAAVSYRWDFGDGTPFSDRLPGSIIFHTYADDSVHTARVEVVDTWGHRCVGAVEIIPEPAVGLLLLLTAAAWRRARERHVDLPDCAAASDVACR